MEATAVLAQAPQARSMPAQGETMAGMERTCGAPNCTVAEESSLF